MGDLPEQRPGDVTILDMEASIEHLTRGTVRNADVLLVVTEPYYRSLETTGRLVPLARDLGLQDVFVVANKLRTERDAAAVREYCDRRGFPLLAEIPWDDNIGEADRLGQALIDARPSAPSVAAIARLAETLVERFGVPTRSGS